MLRKDKIWIRKNAGAAVLLIAITAVLATGMIATSAHSEKDDMKGYFYKSVKYDPDKDLLSFTIPKTMPEGYKFYLHVSGRMFMGDRSSGMSFHAFEKESQSYTWINGKTYIYTLNSDNLDFIMLDFGLMDIRNKKLIYEYTIHIFPNGTKIIDKAIS